MNSSKLFSVLLLCLTGVSACQKNKDQSPDQRPESEISLQLTYDTGKIYELGEPIEAYLDIEERYAPENHCFIKVSHKQGYASILLDGNDIPLGQNMEIPYAIHNEKSSRQKLAFTITPTPGSVANQNINFTLTVSSVNGKTATENIEVKATNSSPIMAKVDYNGDPFEIKEALNIDFDIQKAGFTGDFLITFQHSEGEGFCEIDSNVFNDGKPATIHAAEAAFLVKYQPLSLGKHHLTFSISDGVYNKQLEVKCEVYNDEGLTYPEDGVYIFVKNYEGKAFVTAKEYDSDAGLEVEGIAYLNDDLRILLPLHACEPLAICSSEDKLLSIPGIETSTLKYCGKENTEKIYDAYKSGIISSAPAIEACYNYDPSHPGRWFLPSVHLLSTICYKYDIKDIMKCMKLVGGTLFSEKKLFATSTVYLTDYTYGYDFLGFEYQLEYGRALIGANAVPRAYFPIRNL